MPDADSLADFVKSAAKDDLDIICQCDYGQSRSAAAILEYYEKTGITVFADYRYYPNQLVFNKVERAQRNRWIRVGNAPKYPNRVQSVLCIKSNRISVTSNTFVPTPLQPVPLTIERLYAVSASRGYCRDSIPTVAASQRYCAESIKQGYGRLPDAGLQRAPRGTPSP